MVLADVGAGLTLVDWVEDVGGVVDRGGGLMLLIAGLDDVRLILLRDTGVDEDGWDDDAVGRGDGVVGALMLVPGNVDTALVLLSDAWTDDVVWDVDGCDVVGRGGDAVGALMLLVAGFADVGLILLIDAEVDTVAVDVDEVVIGLVDTDVVDESLTAVIDDAELLATGVLLAATGVVEVIESLLAATNEAGGNVATADADADSCRDVAASDTNVDTDADADTDADTGADADAEVDAVDDDVSILASMDCHRSMNGVSRL